MAHRLQSQFATLLMQFLEGGRDRDGVMEHGDVEDRG
jgi:hypothetical protein